MNQEVPVLKDEQAQQFVPSVWRAHIAAIVEAIRRGDFEVSQKIGEVKPISHELAISMSHNVEAYPVRLASLPEESWETSVCQWMGGYWDVLVDLFSETEGAIDLVLQLRVFETEGSYMFEVQSLHVP